MLNPNNTLLLGLSVDNPRVTARITYTGDINITDIYAYKGNEIYKIVFSSSIINILLRLLNYFMSNFNSSLGFIVHKICIYSFSSRFIDFNLDKRMNVNWTNCIKPSRLIILKINFPNDL